MNDTTRQLEELIARYWTSGGRDGSLGNEVFALALGHFPCSVAVAANCLPILEDRLPSFGGTWVERVEEFRNELRKRIDARTRLDEVGDPDASMDLVLGLLKEHTKGPGVSVDGEILHSLRLSAETRGRAAGATLRYLDKTFGTSLVDRMNPVLEDLTEAADRFQMHALFIGPGNRGFVLGVKVKSGPAGKVRCFDTITGEMEKQAKLALDLAVGECGATWSLPWSIPYLGKSLGLALYMAGLVAMGKMASDALLAATGVIDFDGRVGRVDHVIEKLRAAERAGIRQVVVSSEHREELEHLEDRPMLHLTFVDRVSELPQALYQKVLPNELGLAERARRVRRLAGAYGLEPVEEKTLSNGIALSLVDAVSKAHVNLYRGEKGTITVGGSGTAAEAAKRLVNENLLPKSAETRVARKFIVSDSGRQKRLFDQLIEAGATLQPPLADYELWRVQLHRAGGPVTVVLYKSTKCVVSGGPPTAHDAAISVLASVLGDLGGLRDQESVNSSKPDPNLPHIGTDEAGKGDFFGPLVSAAVFTDKAVAAELQEAGVRDSKKLSDSRVRELAETIRLIAPKAFAVTRINPNRFNSLYSEMRREGKNLNTLLAWGHARSIEDLLRKRVKPEYVLVDQFADTKYMEAKILADTRRSGLPLRHSHRAEYDIAVAAASILARDSFLEWIRATSHDLGIDIPKGASDHVVKVAKEIVAAHGEERLRALAKLSFRTTKKVLSR